MKYRFQITHANGDVTFCKIGIECGTFESMRSLQLSYPDAQIDFLGYAD